MFQHSRLLKVLALLGINLIIIFIFVEAYFVFVYDASDQFNFIKTSRLWTQRHVETNYMGVRDKYYDRADMGIIEKDSIIRIGFVGDSFTYGQGIENPQDRYTELVCAQLQQKSSNIRCYNVALPGANTRDELNLLANEAENFPPFDIVVVQFFANDIEGYAKHEDILRSDTELGKLFRRMRSYPEQRILSFLIRYSYSVEFAYFQWLKRPSSSYPTYTQILEKEYADQEKWQHLTTQFDQLKELSTAKDIPIGFVLFPPMEGNQTPHQLQFVHDKVGTHLDTLQIPHIDLYPTFQDYPPSELVASSFDSHPNEKAHQLAAPEIEQLVIQLLQEKAKAKDATDSAKFKTFAL